MLDYICITSIKSSCHMGLLWLYLASPLVGHILSCRDLLASIFLLLNERPRSELFITR